MKTVTAEMMRELDSRTMNEHGVAGEVLMERAGRGVAESIIRAAAARGIASPSVLLVAGHGNNGGDAFVAARHLRGMGCDVEVRLAGQLGSVRGDAATHLELMQSETGLELAEFVPVEEAEWDVVVDAVLGTGVSGAPRGIAAAAVGLINMLSYKSLIVAVDIPSGLDADSGEPLGEAVHADLTVTMGLPKLGFAMPASRDYVGRVEVVDIGIPTEFVKECESEIDLVTAEDIRELLPRRKRSSHKGTYGHVLIVGGSQGYQGAVAMAARAAVRSGAGLVSCIVPRGIAQSTACLCCEAMVHGVDETGTGSLTDIFGGAHIEDISAFDAVLVGPGMTRHEETRKIVEAILLLSKVPVVLDADALNVQRLDEELILNSGCPVVITPHPGELARLGDCSTGEVQADRLGAAHDAVQRSGAVVVLKGAGTVIAEPGGAVSVNVSGNPGMATGGTGDVLAGLLTGFLGQGMTAPGAAKAAAFVHGYAGDLAASAFCERALSASDVIDELPSAMSWVSER